MWETGLICTSQREAEMLEMKALLDDSTWMLGRNKVVASSETIIYPWFHQDKGELIDIIDVFSKELSNTRDLTIYTPPGYAENEMLVPETVLIMHDGQNLFYPQRSFAGVAWMIQDTLNPLISQGNIETILVIGVANTGQRCDEYTNIYDSSEGCGGNADAYLDFLESTVLPLVSKNFRLPKMLPENLSMIGSSLGGLLSCYAGASRSSIYGRVGCMSASLWWDSEQFRNNVIRSTASFDSIFYMDSGTQEDTILQSTLSTVSDMRKIRNFTLQKDLFVYLDKGGEHNEKYWGARFWSPLLSLY
mmetsp:Transcript_892/g.1213  ORF Transcript_892/g.1213 Transcript_892/m.1213 type:complete len:304 (-) Transcript_892:152-1063(-)